MQITGWFIHADYMLVRYADYRLVHSCRSFPKTAFWPITKKLFWQEISCNTKCYIILLAHLLFIQFWLQFRLFTLIVCFIRHWRKLTFLNHIYVHMYECYRWMSRSGGWVWVQSYATIVHNSRDFIRTFLIVINPLTYGKGGGAAVRPLPSWVFFNFTQKSVGNPYT